MAVTAPKRRIITLKAKPKAPEPLAPSPSPPVSKTKLGKEPLKAATAWLEATWPLAFRSPIRPLAIGSGEEVRALAGGFTVGEINAALKAWTHRPDYQRAIVAGRMRVRLDGEDGGAITEPERDHAVERLKKLERRKSPAAGQPQGQALDDEDEKTDEDNQQRKAST